MAFIIIVTVLFAERYLLEQEDFRQHTWFRDYCRWFKQLPMGEWLSESRAAILALLFLPLSLVLIVHSWSVATFQGLPEWIFAWAVLIISLGPKDLEHQVSSFLYARDQDAPDSAREIAAGIMQHDTQANEPELSILVSESIVEQANNRLMAVLFWFVVLGPFGAVLYRLTSLAENFSRNDPARKNMNQQAFHLLHILDWVPARLLAATYALVGHFDNVLLAWKHWQDNNRTQYESDAAGLLILTGSAAVGHTHDDAVPDQLKDLPPLIEDALGLVLRSLTVWVVLLGIMQLAVWIT
jgi:membrane protein required for beta-lactamase induction